eukprot:scaffold1596_cov302-Pinguiococcus_pyrenoidosus.AAC.41
MNMLVYLGIYSGSRTEKAKQDRPLSSREKDLKRKSLGLSARDELLQRADLALEPIRDLAEGVDLHRLLVRRRRLYEEVAQEHDRLVNARQGIIQILLLIRLWHRSLTSERHLECAQHV